MMHVGELQPPASIHALIFDCDGVLVDTEPAYALAFRQTLLTRNIDLSVNYLRQVLCGQSLASCFEWLNKTHQLHADSQFHRDLVRATQHILDDDIQPIAGVKELIHDLNCPIAVASNGSRQSVLSNLERCGLRTCFNEKIYTVEQVINPKPAPDIYRLAALGLGLSAADCLVIEDSPLGVQSALSAGASVCWLTEVNNVDMFAGQAVTPAHSMEDVRKQLRQLGVLKSNG